MNEQTGLGTVLSVRTAEKAHDVKALTDLLATGDRMGRVAAAHALGVLGARESIDSLLRFTHASDWLLRGAAIQALGAIGERRVADVIADIGVTDESMPVRFQAAEALRAMGDSRETSILISIATTTSSLSWLDRQARRSAVKRLVELRVREAAPLLRSAAASGPIADRLRLTVAIWRLSRQGRAEPE